MTACSATEDTMELNKEVYGWPSKLWLSQCCDTRTWQPAHNYNGCSALERYLQSELWAFNKQSQRGSQQELTNGNYVTWHLTVPWNSPNNCSWKFPICVVNVSNKTPWSKPLVLCFLITKLIRIQEPIVQKVSCKLLQYQREDPLHGS